MDIHTTEHMVVVVGYCTVSIFTGKAIRPTVFLLYELTSSRTILVVVLVVLLLWSYRLCVALRRLASHQRERSQLNRTKIDWLSVRNTRLYCPELGFFSYCFVILLSVRGPNRRFRTPFQLTYHHPNSRRSALAPQKLETTICNPTVN